MCRAIYPILAPVFINTRQANDAGVYCPEEERDCWPPPLPLDLLDCPPR